MRRTNQLTATTPRQEPWRKRCAFDWLVGQAAHWNELTYRRRQQYFQNDGNVWDAQTSDLYEKYGPVVGTGTAQQVKRKNDDAWKAFFETLDNYYNGELEEKPSPPGYRGNRDDGYELQGYVRNDQYSFTWRKNRSTLEFTVGKNLKEKYGMSSQKLRLNVHGNPRWTGENSGLELSFDDDANCFRVDWTVKPQPTDIQQLRQSDFTHTLSSSNTKQKHAAIDIGANNTLTILTETGDSLVYHARPQYTGFKHDREHIDTEKSRLPDNTYTSKRIRGQYKRLYARRDHHRNAAIKHAANWLLERNVDTVYVGELTGVLSTHWSARVNEKTHAFWSHRQLTEQLEHTFDLAGIDVVFVSEHDTSSTCPHCDSTAIDRDGDSFTCTDCGIRVHSDVAGAANILENETSVDVDVEQFFRPMARPTGPLLERDGRAHEPDTDTTVSVSVAHLEWNDHEWTPRVEGTLGSFDQRGLSESVRSTLAPVGCGDYERFPRL